MPRESFHAVLMADVVERADVGMVQRRDGPGLAVEALPGLGIVGEMSGKNFDGDGSVETRVARTIHLAHAACTGRGNDFVRSNSCARGQGHGWRNYSPEAGGLLIPNRGAADASSARSGDVWGHVPRCAPRTRRPGLHECLHNLLCKLCKGLRSAWRGKLNQQDLALISLPFKLRGIMWLKS